MGRVKHFNPGDRVVLPNGDRGEVVCVHAYPDRASCCDVRVLGSGLVQVLNKDLERQ